MSLRTFMPRDYSRPDADFPDSLSHIKGGGIFESKPKQQKTQGLPHIQNKQFSEGNPTGHKKEEPETENQC